MMNKKTYHYWFLFFIISGFNVNAFALTTVDLRAEVESWDIGGSSRINALLYGVGVTKSLKNDLALSAGFVMGKFNVDEQVSVSNERIDFDLGVSYNFHPKWVLYSGYRMMSLKHKNELSRVENYDDRSQGLGLGLMRHFLLTSKLYGYMRISSSLLYAKANKIGASRKGAGYSYGIEGGIIYPLPLDMILNINIKQHNTFINYRQTPENWMHNYLRTGISLSHTF